MLDFHTRLNGLRATLSAKLAQDDLHIVDSLDLPTDDPDFLTKLVEERNWGPAVLFVDDTDIMPLSITGAADKHGHYNLMPVYGRNLRTEIGNGPGTGCVVYFLCPTGLNVYSMLKHQTLVLTLAALERIEERILFHLHRTNTRDATGKFRQSQV